MILKEKMRGKKSLREALAAYNGSGPDAARYGEKVLARIAEKLMEGR